MKVLTGKQGVVSIRIDGVFVPVFCATDFSYQYDHEEILTTSRNSGTSVDRETRLHDWSITVSGLTKVDNSDGQISFFWLLTQSIRGTKQTIRIRYTDADGNVKNITGTVLIKQGQIASAVSGFSVASQTFPGCGEPEFDELPGIAPTDLFKLYLSTTPGAFEVSDNDLGGATEIMLVGREDGMGFKEVAGTPIGRQFRFTDSTTYGTITFDSSLVFNPGEIVYIQYKKPI